MVNTFFFPSLFTSRYWNFCFSCPFFAHTLESKTKWEGLIDQSTPIYDVFFCLVLKRVLFIKKRLKQHFLQKCLCLCGMNFVFNCLGGFLNVSRYIRPYYLFVFIFPFNCLGGFYICKFSLNSICLSITLSCYYEINLRGMWEQW